ncbi:TPA: Ail/Lom family outer membrane beta-barrel protein, partial [Escherichia coli]
MECESACNDPADAGYRYEFTDTLGLVTSFSYA